MNYTQWERWALGLTPDDNDYIQGERWALGQYHLYLALELSPDDNVYIQGERWALGLYHLDLALGLSPDDDDTNDGRGAATLEHSDSEEEIAARATLTAEDTQTHNMFDAPRDASTLRDDAEASQYNVSLQGTGSASVTIPGAPKDGVAPARTAGVNDPKAPFRGATVNIGLSRTELFGRHASRDAGPSWLKSMFTVAPPIGACQLPPALAGGTPPIGASDIVTDADPVP